MHGTLTWHVDGDTRCRLDVLVRGGYSVVELGGGDDWGLYVGGVRNDFGTSLVCRGPLTLVLEQV